MMFQTQFPAESLQGAGQSTAGPGRAAAMPDGLSVLENRYVEQTVAKMSFDCHSSIL